MSPGQIAYGNFKQKLDQHGFELATITTFGLAGLNYMLDHRAGERSTIGEQLAPFDMIWSGFYVLAFIAVVFGIFFETQRFRVAGLLLFAFGSLMQFVAAVFITPLELRDAGYLIFFVAGVCRADKAARTVIPRGRDHASAPTST